MNDPKTIEHQIRRDARRKVRGIVGFRWHARVYVLVSVLLVAINLLTTPLFLWCLFPIGGWGVGVLLHAFAARGHDEREALVEAEVQRQLRARQDVSPR